MLAVTSCLEVRDVGLGGHELEGVVEVEVEVVIQAARVLVNKARDKSRCS